MTFSSKQFRDALQDSTKLPQRLQKYLSDTRKANVKVMYGMVEEFFKILNDKETPLLKVNALFALQLFLQTCEYPAVEMTEAFLLPNLQEVAFYQSDKRTYGKTSQYFKDRGYPGSTPNLQQLSHNYVTIATNILFLAAATKPHNYFYTDHLSTPSAFKVQVDKLKLKKVQTPQYGKEWNEKYEANLNRFGGTPDYESNYVNLFKQKVEKHLVEGGKARETLDFRRILKNGDSWLSSQLLGCLNESLLDDNFSSRRLALGQLNDLFLSGDIEAIMIVNEGEAVENVCERIMEVKGSSDLGRGTQIYPQIPGQLDIKKNFYIQFLRCLQNWAKLVPTSIYLTQQEESRVAKLYRKFKEKQFIFPSNDLSQRLARQFEQNMKINQERNNYIVQTLNQGQSSRNHSVASNRLSKYSQKISLIKEMRESTILTLPQIEKLIEEAQQALIALPQSQRDVSKNMKNLKYFAEQFQKKFQTIQESVTESRLENTYVRGLRCLEKIEQIGPIYGDYQNGRIDYKKFAENVKNKCSYIDKNKSKISDILSKLSKSKDINSRSGLQLSHSRHTMKPKEADLNKADFVLQIQKSANLRERVSQTRTIMNMSNLEEDPLSSGNNKVPSSNKSKQEELKSKLPSKISIKGAEKVEQISIISKSSESVIQKVQPKETAKFIVHDQYSLKPIISKQQSFGKQISKQSSKLSIKQENSKHDKNSSHHASSRPSGHFNENRSPYKPKQQFSDQSSWSDSEDQKPKKPSPESQKQKSSFKSAFNNSKKYQTEKAGKGQKSREVFSSSSFSQYNESNEELRQVIDKSENPDFKMLFNKSSLHSKMSKHTGQSHEHYMGVLQSLAPKSIEQPQRQVSHYSKDKSTSQLPPKSNFDTSSRMDPHRSNHKLTASSGFKEKMILENEPQIIEIKRSQTKSHENEKNSKIVIQEDKKMSAINPNKSNPKIQLGPQGNKSSSEKPSTSKHNSRLTKNEIVSIPSQYELQQPEVIQPSINREKAHSKQSSIHHPKQSSIHQSKQQYAIKENQYYNIQKNNSKLSSNKSGINISQVNVIKEQKIKQIKELEDRIKRLKEDQKKLKTVRSQWLSPTRPQTLRTAISPRFRNTQTNYTHSLQSFKQIDQERAERRRHQFIKQHRGEQMNFDVIDLFRPPEGRLIYHRLYKKDLSQLDLKQKKKILKNKDLVFRNQDIEIGLIVHKQAKDLKIIYYITPNQFLKTFLFKVDLSTKMAVHLIPNSLCNLQPRKQYRIYIFAEVLQFPYKMPVLHFKYHPELLSLQQNLFEKNQINYFTSIIPFFFIKFLTMRTVTLDKVNNQWNSAEIIRSQETIYSRKILPKHFYILQFFPQLTNLQSKQYETVYGMECQYGSTRFLMKIVLKINKFMYVQGVLTGTKNKQNSEKIMEFAICCMSSLLTKHSETET